MLTTNSTISHLECSLTSEKFDHNLLYNLSPVSKKPLFAKYDLEKASKTLTKESLQSRVNSMWRYIEVMPVINRENIITLGEGFTPLLHSKNLGNSLGMKNLFIKDESNNPTGSFKARGLSSAVSKAIELGQRKLTLPSAGNAAGAMSAYAAAAGLKFKVFMPKDAPLPNKVECIAFGADVHLVDGYINDAGKLSIKASEDEGFFDLSTLKEPYRVEGKKTMGYEIIEQLGFNVPDVIIYPTGGGTGIVGIWKALDEMEKMNLIGSKRPRMICVQAKGCSPIVNAYKENKKYAKEIIKPKTLAAGMRVPVAVGDFLVLRSIIESGGDAITVSDEEMIESVKVISNQEGIFPAPEGGATLSAMKKLIQKNIIDIDERVVLLNTGSGYKYLDSIAKYLN
ncbi:MAG: threonine synthase [Chloroflexi bacterium]|nr:threonine synthase [Chloroflexota bacterium]